MLPWSDGRKRTFFAVIFRPVSFFAFEAIATRGGGGNGVEKLVHKRKEKTMVYGGPTAAPAAPAQLEAANMNK